MFSSRMFQSTGPLDVALASSHAEPPTCNPTDVYVPPSTVGTYAPQSHIHPPASLWQCADSLAAKVNFTP